MPEEKKQTYYEYDPVQNVIFKCEYRKCKGEYKLRKTKHENKAEIPGNYGEQVKQQAGEIKHLQNQLDQRMAMLETADNTFRDLMEKLESRTEQINKLKCELKNTNEQFAQSLAIDEKTQQENEKLKEVTRIITEQYEKLKGAGDIKKLQENLEYYIKATDRQQNKINRLKDENKLYKTETDTHAAHVLRLTDEAANDKKTITEITENNDKLKKSILKIMKISFDTI